MSKQTIHSNDAPAAIGTYSQAIRSGDFVFLSGSLDHVVKLTIFLTDLGNFAAVNSVMEDYFDQPYPARAAVGVASLPKGVDIEADAILAV
jgi:enamine deaminase RidA (YjgF/YER057c/UK114 family)